MKKTWIILAALLAIIVLCMFWFLSRSGAFKTINPHIEGTVLKTYTNVPGAEDFDVDYENGLLFISSTDRWALHSTQASSTDGIYLLDLNKPDTPHKIATTYTEAFHPHGISFISIDGQYFLFVVNHNEHGNFIETLQFQRDTLFHISSFSHDLMCCPNDVVGIGTNQFYITNDHGNASGFKRTMEDYLQLAKSYLLYYDGKETKKVFEGMKYANGIAVSSDGDYVYASETMGGKINILSRNVNTGSLHLSSSINLHSGLDNIIVDPTGNLWIGSHPKLLDFVAHASNAEKKSPSQVFKVTPGEEGVPYGVEEIFLDDGSLISGSSVALRYKAQLFIGGVFESKIVKISLIK